MQFPDIGKIVTIETNIERQKDNTDSQSAFNSMKNYRL